MVKPNLCGMTADEISDLISPSGFTKRHANSVVINLYKKKIPFISDFIRIPYKLREQLDQFAVSGIYLPVSSSISDDKSVKYLFRNEQGLEFETVYIPDKKRHTVCVSTQSGCRMGCKFCLTGRFGFRGNLTAGEIINQVISIPETGKITHVVFMGMGEPFDNYETVLKACRILSAEWGLSLTSRNITVSTVGVLPETKYFIDNSECNLTLSLLSPFRDERQVLVPAEKNYPANEIISMMKGFNLKKKRRFSIAYMMINGLNDSEMHLTELKAILKGSSIRVNLLPYHPISNDRYFSSTPERMQYFKHNLIMSGISASIRKSRGSDISAACGLLAASAHKNL